MRDAGVVVLGPPLVVRCIERPQGKFEIQVLCESRSEPCQLAWILRAAEIVWIQMVFAQGEQGLYPEDLEAYVASERSALPGAVLLVFWADKAVVGDALIRGMLVRHSDDAETWLSRVEGV